MEANTNNTTATTAAPHTTTTSTAPIDNSAAAPAKKSKIFPIILGVLLIGGGAFGITKYLHAQSHEENNDAQVEANHSPVNPLQVM